MVISTPIDQAQARVRLRVIGFELESFLVGCERTGRVRSGRRLPTAPGRERVWRVHSSHRSSMAPWGVRA